MATETTTKPTSVGYVKDPKTGKWWYISTKRFHKPGRPLWVGKFDTQELAQQAAKTAGEPV